MARTARMVWKRALILQAFKALVMTIQLPVCMQCIKRCTTESKDLQTAQKNVIAVKADSLLITDIKSIPSLLNLASTFDAPYNKVPLQTNLQVHVIPSSYKLGCSPRNNCLADMKGNEILRLLKWCHYNVKGVKVYSPKMLHCQAAYLQAMAASLSSQSVIVSSETFTSGFNGLGVLTLCESITSCEQLIFGKPLIFKPTKIIGIEIIGFLPELTVSTDLVLQFIKFIRPLKDCIIEIWGSSLHLVSLSDRITISNMVKETNAICIFFPCDEVCASFLKATSSLMLEDKKVVLSKETVDVTVPRAYDENHQFDLSMVETSISGPKREVDRIPLANFSSEFNKSIYAKISAKSYGLKVVEDSDPNKELHGSIVGISLAGCTNSSNAFVTLQAGLIAKKLIESGCKLSENIRGFYSTGAGLADLYLDEAGLSDILIEFGLEKSSSCCVDQDNFICKSKLSERVITCAVLSGNGNYENRKFSGAQANFLMSSPLALLFAAFGNITVDMSKNILPLNCGAPLRISELWPDRRTLIELECKHVLPSVCSKVYKEFSTFSPEFEAVHLPSNDNSFPWNLKSLYITRPPFLDMASVLGDINSSRVLLSMGDNISSEIISPSGSMGRNSTSAHYLAGKGLSPRQFDSYGNRRGNHNIVAMGVFNNTKLLNALVPMKGPYTLHMPSNTIVDIYEAAMQYLESGTSTIILAGSKYGHGPTRDSGARGVRLLGVSAVVARSFHDSHRKELINQGVMPIICQDSDCIDPTCEVSVVWTDVKSDVSVDVSSDVKSDVRSDVSSDVSSSCWEGRLSWGCTTSPRIHCKSTSLSCNGVVKVSLAVYNDSEMDVLRCGGLLKWRVKNVAERKEKLRADKAAQMESNNFNSRNSSKLQLIPLQPFSPVIAPNYGYPRAMDQIPVVQYVPVLQFMPVSYDLQQMSLSQQSPDPYVKN